MGKEYNERDTVTNAKAILIILVVAGHFVQLIPSWGGVRQGIILWIYSFHMPAFVFISGYLSKNAEKRREKAFADIFVPFIVFQVVFGIINVLLSGSSVAFGNLLHPELTLWYLLALFIWRYTLPDVIKIRGVILVSIVISVLTGYLPKVTNAFAAQRTFGYFCFFILGYYCRKETLEKAWRIKPYLSAVLLVAELVLLIIWMKADKSWFSRLWKVLSHQAVYESETPWKMTAEYLAAFLAGCINTVLLITAVPRTGCKQLGKIGNNTMAIYLSHATAYFFCKKYLALIEDQTILTVSVSAAAVACVVLFSRQWYANAFSWFLKQCKTIAIRSSHNGQTREQNSTQT